MWNNKKTQVGGSPEWKKMHRMCHSLHGEYTVRDIDKITSAIYTNFISILELPLNNECEHTVQMFSFNLSIFTSVRYAEKNISYSL